MCLDLEYCRNGCVLVLTLQDHLKALSELEGKLEDLNGWGQLLVKDCVVPDGEVIQERMDSLKLQYDALSSASSERQAALEESLLSLGQFESAYEDLWAWLNKANGHLEDFEPITGDPDAVFAQLAKHKVCMTLQYIVQNFMEVSIVLVLVLHENVGDS